jgi:PKD repeat protein
VYFDVWDQAGNWIAGAQAPAAGDGTVAATIDGLAPGTYEVGVTAVGGYFASDPAPRVSGLNLPLEPIEIGTSFSASAFFLDADSPLDHTATWDWGDDTTCDTSVGGECDLTEPSGATPGEVTGSHAYTEPGVYTVRLTVADGDGHTAEAVYEFVVVYSLQGGEGFVTGGGWIWSQAGWCQLDDACAAAAGKANFGFVSRYKRGAHAPTGSTEFNFSAGGLNFHSDSYEWLVVNQGGTNAQFKGSGTVNGGLSPGGGLYKFMIWAGDGGLGGDDTLRIKIWYVDAAGNEVTVYDNGFSQAIGGGSIVIHREE